MNVRGGVESWKDLDIDVISPEPFEAVKAPVQPFEPNDMGQKQTVTEPPPSNVEGEAEGRGSYEGLALSCVDGVAMGEEAEMIDDKYHGMRPENEEENMAVDGMNP